MDGYENEKPRLSGPRYSVRSATSAVAEAAEVSATFSSTAALAFHGDREPAAAAMLHKSTSRRVALFGGVGILAWTTSGLHRWWCSESGRKFVVEMRV